MLEVLFKEWARNNPEQAAAVNSTAGTIAAALVKAAQQVYPYLEALCPEIMATRLRRRYEGGGDAIQVDEATRLAFLMMAHRIPYTGPDPRPDGIIGSIRDYEMLAYDALRDDSLSILIEASAASPVAYRAVQEVLRRLRGSSEEIPSKLQEWAYDVAVGDRELPAVGPGRSPFTNKVRDAAIVQTMETLVVCGLSATRNEATDTMSAADVVSVALGALGTELQAERINKMWTSRNKSQFRS